MRAILFVIFLIILLSCAFGASVEYKLHLIERLSVLLDIDNARDKILDSVSNYSDFHVNDPEEIKCPEQSGTLVVMLIGASNAANFVTKRTSSEKNVSVFYDGRCYKAKDPIPGATGSRGSIWPMVAESVLHTGIAERVTLVPVAVGSSRIESWAPHGIYFDRIGRRIDQLRKVGLNISHALIIQGELDAVIRTNPESYTKDMSELVLYLRANGAKVIVGLVGKCDSKVNSDIRAAQQKAIELTGAFKGPDMDKFGPRINGCHMTETAGSEAAKAWSEALLAVQ